MTYAADDSAALLKQNGLRAMQSNNTKPEHSQVCIQTMKYDGSHKAVQVKPST